VDKTNELDVTFRILYFSSEVWQISNREINKILSTEMDVLGGQQANQGWKE
jgi:hypothetical protein